MSQEYVDYRFVVELHEHDDPETVAVETTTGDDRWVLDFNRIGSAEPPAS